MVIVNIIGGIGNQMFQCAAGLALSERLGTELLYDIRMFDNYKLHNGFELNRVFLTQKKVANDHEIRRIIGWRASKFGKRLMRNRILQRYSCKKYFIEPCFSSRSLDLLPKDIYMKGYWQSEKFFRGFEHIVHQHFRYKSTFANEENIKISRALNKSLNSVSIHVRRGDYILNEKTNFVHGACDIDYYKNAMHYIEARINNPEYYIFSDEIEWAEKHLPVKGKKIFINHNNGIDSFNDMRLMSLCRHNIIANSSFSWWGAWLNMNKNKIVISPKRWFRNENIRKKGIVPDSWIKL